MLNARNYYEKDGGSFGIHESVAVKLKRASLRFVVVSVLALHQGFAALILRKSNGKRRVTGVGNLRLH